MSGWLPTSDDGIDAVLQIRVQGSAVFCLDLAWCTLIPDASCAMVGNAVEALCLHFLHRIVEEEINQDSIELRLRVLTPNLPPQQLDAPDAAPPQLDLPRVPALNHLFLADVGLQRRTVLQAAERVEDLRDAVVGEHGDLVDVVEGAEAGALEAGPEVRHEDLGAFVEADGGVFVAVAVVEAGEVVDDEVDERGGGSFASVDAGGEFAIEMVS